MRQEQDAKGQFAKSQADRKSTGVASAKPTVITRSDDVTGHRTPPGQKEHGKDWHAGFDENAPDRSGEP
ncbi:MULTISPECIES: hypothetical protein [unclassified Rhizobium]|uniref:hypothetical protein n=1 Tax=unclassified Rhizobium TaxID=2613769 RepID=UPI0009E8990B|nr:MULTISPECIES: hypothetical protein [unclassified Rhizobium]